jgi:GT2 family glycosyltransferase
VSAAAVVIVSWNAAQFLPRVLRCLEQQTLPPARTIVVDNGSADGSADLVESEFPSVQLIRLDENAGFAKANNIGLEAAGDCDYVALLNPDAFPEPEWLERLVGAAESYPEAGFFASRMMCESDPAALDGAGDVYHASGLAERRYHGRRLADVPSALVPGETFSACAGAALYRRDAYLEVGGLDDDFFAYYEDSDLAFRLRLAGWRCRYVPDSVVAHVGSASTGPESDFALYHIHRNMVWTWAKCMPWPLWLVYLPMHLYANVSMAISYLLRRRPVVLRAKRDALRGLPRQLRKRRVLQREARAGAAEIRPVLDRGLAVFTPRGLAP